MRHLLFCALFISAPLHGSETISYSYDARGRLVKVQHSGSVNDGIRACYLYDKADNRSNVTVAAADCGATALPPAFSINDVSVTEGGSLVLTVTKSGVTSTSYSVNYATANGSAAAGSDYTSTSGTLTFSAGDATKTITVATIDDTTVESSETVLVNLSGATGGATISDGQGVGTINDNDNAPPNQPPVANPDTLSVPRCEIRYKNVVANDTDPDGNTPLVLLSENHTWAWVENSTTIGVQAPDAGGSFNVTYTVRDSLGATDTGTLTVTITGTVCP